MTPKIKTEAQFNTVVLVATILISLLMVLSLIYNFLVVYWHEQNPLMPNYLIDYIGFPLYFIIPLFIGIIFYCARSLVLKRFNTTVIVSVFLFTFLFFINQGHIYKFIQSFSPYASNG